MPRTVRLEVPPALDGARLDAALFALLPAALGLAVSRSAVRRMVVAGGVTVAGRVERRPSRALRAGSGVVARLRFGEGPPASSPRSLVVLLDEAGLLVVDKPAGLPTVPTADPARPHLVGLARAWLTARTGVADPYLAVHQRLDVDTTGVVLFATDAAANGSLAAQFAARRVDKRYLALTARPAALPPRAWVAEGPLAPSGSGRGARMRVDPQGQAARTELRVVQTFDAALLVEAHPTTGRKHQVRAHLAEAGLPLLGDPRYGGPASPLAPRVMLHAASLRLLHPLTGAPLTLRSPLPPDFRDALRRLQGGRGRARRR